MTRALVLGGGGPVGVGWESGLVAGLAKEGVPLGAADLIVGTSAGSIVGSRLALGLDPADTASAVSRALPADPEAPGGPEVMAELMTAWTGAAARGLTPEQTRAELGALALRNEADEAIFTGAEVFAGLSAADWPAAFRCTAIDTGTGELRVWDQAAGVSLTLAVASSCAVPGVFPPVTIAGRRYMDGGMRTPLNADLAAGHAAVIVVSCLPLELPPGVSDPLFTSLAAQIEAEFAAVRGAGGTIEAVGPGQEFLEVSGWGANLMDPARVPGAYQAGLRQAAGEATRLRAVWGS